MDKLCSLQEFKDKIDKFNFLIFAKVVGCNYKNKSILLLKNYVNYVVENQLFTIFVLIIAKLFVPNVKNHITIKITNYFFTNHLIIYSR